MRAGRLAVLVALLLLVYFGVSLVIADVATEGTHLPLGAGPTSIGPHYLAVSFPSRVDRLTMRGWLFFASPHNRRAVIVAHGFRQNRLDRGVNEGGVARDLLAHGFDVLVFDFRSCGLSAGDRFTIGNLETRDLLGAYDFMVARGYPPADLAVIGFSMGAATTLLAAPHLGRVGALVADSSFAELRPILEAQILESIHLPAFFYRAAEEEARLFFGVDPDLRPVDSVRSLPGRPFLFIEGTADHFVPVQQAYELKAASANPASRLALMPGADHVQGFNHERPLWTAAVYSFLAQQLGR